MSFRIPKLKQHRRDKPHGTPLRGRHLRFETCESRLLLAGEGLQLSGFEEGGFLTLGAGGLLSGSANNFLISDAGPTTVRVHGFFDADASLGGLLHSDLLTGSRLSFNLSYLGNKPPEQLTLDAPTENPVRELAAAIVQGPVVGPFLLEAEIGEPVHGGSIPEPTILSELVTEDTTDSLEVNSTSEDEFPDQATKLLTSAEPNQGGFIQLTSHEQARDQGGVVDVSQAVATTRQDYQTKLGALVAKNLDRGAQLPVVEHIPVRKPTLELARAVAFETLPDAPVDVANEMEPRSTQGASQEVPSRDPQTRQFAAAHLHLSSSASQQMLEASEANQSVETRDSSEEKNLAERVETERDNAISFVLADWPLVAATITGALWVDWRGRVRAASVQKPPSRRKR